MLGYQMYIFILDYQISIELPNQDLVRLGLSKEVYNVSELPVAQKLIAFKVGSTKKSPS